MARYASFFCLSVEAGENVAKESTSATVHHDGCAGVQHASGAQLARTTHQLHGMVLGWCWEHPQPPPPAAAASAPGWWLVCCRMKFQSIFLTRASFKLSHILYRYFKLGERPLEFLVKTFAACFQRFEKSPCTTISHLRLKHGPVERWPNSGGLGLGYQL